MSIVYREAPAATLKPSHTIQPVAIQNEAVKIFFSSDLEYVTFLSTHVCSGCVLVFVRRIFLQPVEVIGRSQKREKMCAQRDPTTTVN
jgi:hypothetical protein